MAELEKSIEGFQITFGGLKAISKRTGKSFFELTDALDNMDLEVLDVALQEGSGMTEEETAVFLSQPGNLLRAKKDITLDLISFVTVAKAATDMDEEKKS